MRTGQKMDPLTILHLKKSKENWDKCTVKQVDTSDLPRRESFFKPYVPAPIPSWFRQRMDEVAQIPSYTARSK